MPCYTKDDLVRGGKGRGNRGAPQGLKALLNFICTYIFDYWFSVGRPAKAYAWLICTHLWYSTNNTKPRISSSQFFFVSFFLIDIDIYTTTLPPARYWPLACEIGLANPPWKSELLTRDQRESLAVIARLWRHTWTWPIKARKPLKTTGNWYKTQRHMTIDSELEAIIPIQTVTNRHDQHVF